VDVTFVTPFAALFALTAAVPLAAWFLRARRLREIRGALGLEEPAARSHLALVTALVGVPALLGLAAAQPVVETARTTPERTDAQAFVVVDVSRSMLAAGEPGAPTRFERARQVALGIRDELPAVPFGIASLTDRVLPHVFPTTDDRVFASTLEKALDIEHPPPGAFYLTVATNLNALRSVPETSYFPPTARKRVLVVLTDGETQTPEPELARSFKRRPRIETIFVRFWDANERIYETGVAEGGYRPDPRSDAFLDRTASLVGGQVFEESDASAAVGAVRAAVGQGETVPREHASGRLALMPYLTLASLLPLGLVLLRRNLWWSRELRSRRRNASDAAPAQREHAPAVALASPGAEISAS
jgi:hypothetical protein